jgi:acyl dehydratase
MPNRRYTYLSEQKACSAVTCPNFAVTAMYDNQFTEPFFAPDQIKAEIQVTSSVSAKIKLDLLFVFGAILIQKDDVVIKMD